MNNINKTKKQEQDFNKLIGWLITLLPTISVIAQYLITLPKLPYVVILCICDRESLKRQDVWKNGKIAWGWCLFSPVYLYKRARLLKESLLKFWLNLLQFCILFAYIAIYALNVSNSISECVYDAGRAGFSNYATRQYCICSTEHDENYCIQKHIIPDCKRTMQQKGLNAQISEQFCLCWVTNGEDFCLHQFEIAE